MQLYHDRDGQITEAFSLHTGTYAQATKEVTVTIGKANAVAATVTANNRTYDGTEKPLVTVTGEATGGEMQYALGTNVTTAPAENLYTTSIPAKTEAGIYYVWYKVVGDANHNDTEPGCVEVNIVQKETEKHDTTPSGGGGGSLPQTTDPAPAPNPTPSETTEHPAATESTITQDAFTGVSETIEKSADGTAVVTSVAGNGGKTLRITGTVNQNGTNHPVSSFATKSFSNVDVKSIIIDLKASGNPQTVTFMPRTFKGSETKKLTLRLTSSRQVKFSSGALSGSKIKKVVVSGLNKRSLRESGRSW